jgi:hypothetical protein
MDTTESSAPHAHLSTDDHDDTVEAHYACLERLRPHACNEGRVYIGHLVVVDGYEIWLDYGDNRHQDRHPIGHPAGRDFKAPAFTLPPSLYHSFMWLFTGKMFCPCPTPMSVLGGDRLPSSLSRLPGPPPNTLGMYCTRRLRLCPRRKERDKRRNRSKWSIME